MITKIFWQTTTAFGLCLLTVSFISASAQVLSAPDSEQWNLRNTRHSDLQDLRNYNKYGAYV